MVIVPDEPAVSRVIVEFNPVPDKVIPPPDPVASIKFAFAVVFGIAWALTHKLVWKTVGMR